VTELDHVRAETLQAFYTWVYEDRTVVDGLQEEMDKSKASDDKDGTHLRQQNAWWWI